MKCKSCGGTLVYSPNTESLYCSNCGNTEDIDFEKFVDKHDISQSLQTALEGQTLRCQNCGAAANIKGAKICEFCGSPIIQDLSTVVDAVVPFRIDKDQARTQFKKWVGGKFWAPIGLKKIAKAKRLQGYYVPAMAYDAKTETKYSGVKVKTHSRTFIRNGTPVSETYQTRQPFSGTRHDDIFNVLVTSSSVISNSELNDIEPFDYANIYKYNEAFLAGYNADMFQIDERQAYEQAHEEMEEYIQDQIRASEGADVESLSQKTKYLEESKARYMLPVYKSSYKFKNKNYDFFINGSNGRCAGEYPKSKAKIIFAVILFLAVIVTALYFILK